MNVVKPWTIKKSVYGAIKKNPMKEQEPNKDHLLPAHMVC